MSALSEGTNSQAQTEKTRPADDIAPTVVSSSRDITSNSYQTQSVVDQTQNQNQNQNGGYTSQYPVNSPDDVKAYPGQPQPTYNNQGQQAPAYYQHQPQLYYTPYGPPSGYANATPLHALQSASAPVDCPACGNREMTRTEAVTGMTTQ